MTLHFISRMSNRSRSSAAFSSWRTSAEPRTPAKTSSSFPAKPATTPFNPATSPTNSDPESTFL
ncbi:MAG: hypothetical protein ACK56F_30995, partial [bacterium]